MQQGQLWPNYQLQELEKPRNEEKIALEIEKLFFFLSLSQSVIIWS